MKKLTPAILIVLAMVAGGVGRAAAQAAPLVLEDSVELPGYTGDFDHFALDSARSRILLAAEDHATLEVFDLKTGKHLRTVTGFETPHSVLVRQGAATVLVTDSGKSMSKLIDANTYKKKGTVRLVPGADSIGYDRKTNIVYVVTGGKDVEMATSELAAVNPDTGKKLGAITFNDNHVEAMALARNGESLYISLAQTNKVAVVDRRTMKVTALWPVPVAEINSMMALDETHHRLYVVCRKPGMVAAINTDTGKVTNSLPAPLRADDVLFDAASARIYVPGGEGYIGVYDASDPDHLKLIAKVPSAPGAKTGMLLPGMKKLVLAASPGDTKAVARVLTYRIQ